MENKIYFDVAKTLSEFEFKDPTSNNPRRSFSGKYPLSTAERIIESSSGVVDPNIMLGLAMAETTFGKKTPRNIYHVDWMQHPELQKFRGGELTPSIYDKWSAHHMKELIDTHQSLTYAIQLWQGGGKLGRNTEPSIYEGKTKRWFGKKQNIDAGKEMPHGLRVKAFADEMKKNPQIQTLIREIAERKKREKSF